MLALLPLVFWLDGVLLFNNRWQFLKLIYLLDEIVISVVGLEESVILFLGDCLSVFLTLVESYPNVHWRMHLLH